MAELKQWVKLWTKALTDPSLDSLSIEDFGRWVKLLLYVRDHGDNGKLQITRPARAIVSLFQCETFECVISVISRFPNCNITDGVTCNVSFDNWSKYQVDSSTARVRKHRQNVTPKKRGEEKRGEKSVTQGSSLRSEPPAVSGNGHPKQAVEVNWEPEDFYLRDFLKNQKLLSLDGISLEDPEWWSRISVACGGLSTDFLEVEFAKMGNWCSNPLNKPPPAANRAGKPNVGGWKQFIGGWLERAHKAERRYGNKATR